VARFFMDHGVCERLRLFVDLVYQKLLTVTNIC